MKVVCTKTRWYFCAYHVGYPIEGFVEFSRTHNGKKKASVYDYRGTTLLWSTTGVQRMDGRSAKLAFTVYAEQEAKKLQQPMRLALSE